MKLVSLKAGLSLDWAEHMQRYSMYFDYALLDDT